MSATRKTRTKTKAKAGSKADDKDTSRRTVRPDEMSAEVIEFITAIDEYKRLYQRPFPSWSEVLDIVKSLGYAKG
jgi:hypothetical protein